MLEKIRVPFLLSPLITLIILAFLAFQCAQLSWHLIFQRREVDVSEIQPVQEQKWLPTIHFFTLNNKPHSTSSHQVTSHTPANPQWQLKGIYAEDGDSVAIIQTPNQSHVVELGEALENGFIVTNITPSSVDIAHNNGHNLQTLTLSSKHLDHLAENMLENNISPTNSHQTRQKKPVIKAISTSLDDLFSHIIIKPMIVSGKPAIQLSAAEQTGFSQLKRLKLQQDDILLSVDGKTPSPDSMTEVREKWLTSQKIFVKIKRQGSIKTITIENKK